MNSLIAIVPIAVGAYVATNLDNFLLLVSLLAHFRDQAAKVVAGYFVCMIIFALAGYWISSVASVAPVEYLGFLGIVPISLGVYELLKMQGGREKAEVDAEKARGAERKAFTTTLISQLGNGADTIVVFGILFADSTPVADLLIILSLAAMAIAFVVAGIYTVRHPALNLWVTRYAHRVMPFVLIVVGMYVLANTASDLLPD